MSYEEIVRDTAEMVKRMRLKWDIISAVLVLMIAALIVMAVRIMWEDHKERKARKMVAWGQYRPTVTDDIQVADGVTFHRMGVPDRR